MTLRTGDMGDTFDWSWPAGVSMPWKECSVMEERLRFVARLLEGEPMAEVCRAFGISRKIGYKLFERYKQEGAFALADRSRRPVRYANQLPAQVESLIVACKREKPHWGARKSASSSSGASPAIRASPPSVPSTPPSTATASSPHGPKTPKGARHTAIGRRKASRPRATLLTTEKSWRGLLLPWGR